MIEGLTEGRMVHYVLDDGPSKGEHRPAVIVKVWRSVETYMSTGTVNLLVFTDGTNDGTPGGVMWRTSVKMSEEPATGTWHWIERA